MIKRSLKIRLDFGNTGKKEELDQLWLAYKQTLKDFLNRLFNKEDLSEEYLKSYESPLSYRYKQCAKRQAFKIFKSWCRSKKKKRKPTLRNISMTLDYRFVELEKSNNSFDLWIKISILKKGNPVLIPSKSYNYLNQYLKDWQLVKGGRLVKQNGRWFLILTFQKEILHKRKEGKIKGIDINYRKLIVTSDGEVIGSDLRNLIEKAVRKKQFSKGYYRVKAEIRNHINRLLKLLISNDLQVLIVENLKNLKNGKSTIWSKAVNKKFNFWSYGYVLTRIHQLCEVAGVQYHMVEPKYTSQTCPICGHRERLNRYEELFKCCQCGFTHDADYIGALNILSRFTQESIVPEMIKSHLKYLCID